MKRVMCIWFPNWAIQRRFAASPAERGRALIVHSPLTQGKTRVLACCRIARERGVKPGMLLVEAQALWPTTDSSVRYELHDSLADRRGLEELAQWCQRFSPSVSLDKAETPDSLFVDVTGVDKELPFAESAVDLLRQHGYWAVAVVAGHVGTAWAVAHYGSLPHAKRSIVVPTGGQREALRPLPVEALRLPDNIVEVLHELNVFRIEQLLALPRAQLPSRFGTEILLGIDRALGALPEIVKPEPLLEPLEACWEFEYPIADARILVAAIEHLLERLLGQLQTEHVGIQRLLCLLKLDRESLHFQVELLRPSSSQKDLMELVRLQVERLRIETEILQVTVRAAVVLPLEFRQDEMFGGSDEANGNHELTGLLERLSNRLGEKAVLRPQLWPDAQPELACRYEPWMEDSPTLPPALRGEGRVGGTALPSGRPPFLKCQPQSIAVVLNGSEGPPREFLWNRQHYFVKRLWGPERIETGWWRGDDIRRDYFIVEADSGERFWLFCNLIDGSWRLHGVFA